MGLEHIVIVGAGQAGVQAAFSLRQKGFDGTLRLVGRERGLPYQRPPLSKAFLTEGGAREDILLRTTAAFAKADIDLADGEEVAELDRAARTVRLASGRRLAYDHVVLALGARNRQLPVDRSEHALDLRTIEDAVAIRERLHAGAKLVVVGGGFVGLEVAASARALGCEVVVLEALDRLMARSCSPALSARVLARHRAAGIDVRLETVAAALHGDGGRIHRVETRSGETLDADVVVVGIGVVPNVELAARAGLVVGDGVHADAHLSTVDPHVSAIGDCASFEYAYCGRRVRLESVQNAVDQGKTVARNALGDPAPYDAVPWFWSDQADLEIQIAGMTDRSTRHVVCEDVDAGRLAVFCYRDDRFEGLETVNSPGDHILGRKALDTGLAPTPDEVAAEGFSFKAWMKEARGRAPAGG